VSVQSAIIVWPESDCHSSANHLADSGHMILPSPLPAPPPKAKAPPPAAPITPVSKKRPAPVEDDDVIDFAPTPKRARTTKSTVGDASVSPTKMRRLEEDGLVMMDTAEENISAGGQPVDVIEID